MIDFENIKEDEIKKYKKKNVLLPVILLIFVLCILGYILFGPGGVLFYLPKNVGTVITDKKIEEMKEKVKKEKENYKTKEDEKAKEKKENQKEEINIK